MAIRHRHPLHFYHFARAIVFKKLIPVFYAEHLFPRVSSSNSKLHFSQNQYFAPSFFENPTRSRSWPQREQRKVSSQTETRTESPGRLLHRSQIPPDRFFIFSFRTAQIRLAKNLPRDSKPNSMRHQIKAAAPETRFGPDRAHSKTGARRGRLKSCAGRSPIRFPRFQLRH